MAASSNLTVTVTGGDALVRRLTALASQMGVQSVGAALVAEAEIEMTEAKRRTPVLTGALRGSGHVGGPFVRNGNVEVVLSFGGPAAPYAVSVHERTDVLHRNGQAKFLESVILESAPYLAARVANRIRRGLGSQYGPSNFEVAQAEASAIEIDDEEMGG